MQSPIKSNYWIVRNLLFMLFSCLSIATVYQFNNFYLENSTKQFASDFFSQNSQVMERGDSYELVYRLATLSDSSQWICISVYKDERLIFQKQKSKSCDKGLFQKVITITANGNKSLRVNVTIGMTIAVRLLILIYTLLPAVFFSMIILIKLRDEKAKLKSYQNEQKKTKDDVEQVLHDIRSPFAYLKFALGDIKKNSDLVATTMKIELIINELCSSKSISNVNNKNDNQSCNVVNIINEILNEKNIIIKNSNNNIKLNFQSFTIYQDFNVKIKSLDLNRIISNIINNSIEAFDGFNELSSYININLKIEEINQKKYGVIEVEDNGSGIPKNKIKQLIISNLSFGKKNGKGLGLKFTKNKLKEVDGIFEIDSDIDSNGNNKTKVSIKIPLNYTIRNEVDLNCINTPNKKFRIALIDDDKYLHNYWRIASSLSDVELCSYNSYYEFKKSNHPTYVPIFLDKNLANGESGFHIGELLNKQDKYRNVYLVTGEEIDKNAIPKFFDDYIPRKEFPKALIEKLKRIHIQNVN